jgi:phospholipid-binding lipoprotein MlaA
MFLFGCASNEVEKTEASADGLEVAVEQENSKDPYEHINRKIYTFNDKLDKYVAKPVSDVYLWVTPQFVQTGIANFFNNLNDISVVMNDTLQGKFDQGAEDTGRFLLNSTVGLLGVFDVAKEVGLEKHNEDFAQTLAVWGVPEGPYLVLPVLGPATTRGIPGAVVDTASNPVTYVGFPVQLLSMLNSRANAEGSLKFIDEAALDPYVFTREAFLQHRKYLVKDGQVDVSNDTLDLEDAFYDDEEESSAQAPTDAVDSIPGSQTELAEQEKVAEAGYSLQLSGGEDNFNQATESFDEAMKAFQKASQSYQDASQKLDQLKSH